MDKGVLSYEYRGSLELVRHDHLHVATCTSLPINSVTCKSMGRRSVYVSRPDEEVWAKASRSISVKAVSLFETQPVGHEGSSPTRQFTHL